jgi:hypothetical protein
MIRAYNVRVQLYDREYTQIAEASVKCSALDPGSACGPAFILARADLRASGKKLPAKVAAVGFMVRIAKGGGR